MNILKDSMFVLAGALAVLAYQRYGEDMIDAVEDMLDKKINMLKKLDNELEEM